MQYKCNLIEDTSYKFSRCLELVENTSMDEAKKLFLECYNADNGYMVKLFEVLFEYLKSEDYSRVFRYFELIFACGDERYIRDIKFYLYLLNYLTDIPFEYKELICDLSYNNVMIDTNDDRFDCNDEISQLNDNRMNLILGIKCEVSPAETSGNIFEMFENKLKERFIEKICVFNRKIKDLAKNKKYLLIVKEVETETKSRNINSSTKFIGIIAQYLGDFIENNKIFTMKRAKTNNWIQAIEFGNFELAKQLLKQSKDCNSLLVSLLDKIISLSSSKEFEFNSFKIIYYLNNACYDKAVQFFFYCLKKDSNYLDKILEWTFKCVKKENYQDMFGFLKLILATNNDTYIRDVKYWLYLLNYLTDIPTEYRELIHELSCNDIMVDVNDKRYSEPSKLNEMRLSILSGKLGTRINTSGVSHFENISFILWTKYCIKFRERNSQLSQFIINQDYNGIVEHINQEEKKRDLSKGLLLLRYLSQCLLNIKNGIYPQISTEFVEDEYEAAYKGNFVLAYKIRSARKHLNGKSEDDAILDMTDAIIKQLEISKEELNTMENETIDFNRVCIEVINSTADNSLVVFDVVTKYMNYINKQDYSELILNLIEICWLENDSTFYVPLLFLFQLTNDIYKFDVDFFVKKLYDALQDNPSSNVARKYFDILNLGVKFGVVVSSKILEKAYNAITWCDTVNDGNDYYYGIDNTVIVELMKEIENSNLGFEVACLKLGIDAETMNFIRLVYAKNYYSCGLDDIGDKFFSIVEKSKGKTNRLQRALEEVRKQKKFYKNRVQELNLHAVKSLIPLNPQKYL